MKNEKQPQPLIFDARGNGGGYISPTMTGDHNAHISDYTAIVIDYDYDSDTRSRRAESDNAN